MADLEINDKTNIGVNMPMRVWVGGIIGFATIVGFFYAGWNDLNSRRDEQFSAVMTQVLAVEKTVGELDNRWQLRLLEFGEKLSGQIKDNSEIVRIRERQDNVLKSLEEAKARITLLEARIAKSEAEKP